MLCHVPSFLFSTLFPATRRKVKKVPVGDILMHIQCKLWRLDKISINHQTTETPSKPCFAMFQASFFQLWFQDSQEKWKGFHRSYFDTYTRQIVKSSINHQTKRNAFQTMFCHVLSFLFSPLISTITRKWKKSTRRSHFDAYARQMMKISVYHQTTETLPNHSLTCSKFPCFNFISSN